MAAGVLTVVLLGAVGANVLAPMPYETQFRDAPSAPPSHRFLLGTDELGRDRLSRLLYGSRVSLLLAPAAALLSTALAALTGALAALLGGWWERVFAGATNLSLSLPWLFALITVRALLPLDVAPVLSVTVTFLLLGLLGWAAPARVVRAAVVSLRRSEFMLQARASGCVGFRLLAVHLLPNLKAVLFSQFLVAIPVFILSEANLGLLGLGVSEPIPSWGNLLRDLENFSELRVNPWLLAPAVLLVLVVTCFQLLTPRGDLVA
jgi:ABC-type dipeptide/oligopeptide/nickel transport system permease subunit